MTIRVPFNEMQAYFRQVLLRLKFPEDKAEKCALIFAENSLDGVYSHGVNRFPRFVEYTRKGYINPLTDATRTSQNGMMEQWDGQFAPGPTNALKATDRAMEIAKKNGMGLVALANTNHWMRGGKYGWHCAEKGFAFLGWTNTIANLPAWGAKECKLGNNPLVIALPHQNQAIVLDMAMSQYSYGKMEDLQKVKEELPLPGGFNSNNQLTANPSEVLASGRPLPIGYWKGAGLSLMLDLLAAILSSGSTTSKITQQNKDEYGVSQVFIAIDLKQLANFPSIEETIQSVLDDFIAAETIDSNQPLRYPGQRVLKTREENLKSGIPVNPDIWQTILKL